MRGRGCRPVDVNVIVRRRVSTRRRIIVRAFSMAVLNRNGNALKHFQRRSETDQERLRSTLLRFANLPSCLADSEPRGDELDMDLGTRK